jgi:hypothetical protein
MPAPIRITLELTPTGRYRAMLGAKLLVTGGLDPETAFEAQHKGSPIVAMRCKLGEAAKWTVRERDRGGLRRELWQPMPDAVSSIRGGGENEQEAAGGSSGA